MFRPCLRQGRKTRDYLFFVAGFAGFFVAFFAAAFVATFFAMGALLQ